MGYYVLGDQGQKYGPADVATLSQWVAEGRIVANTMLMDETSGGQVVASSVPGLQFAQQAPPMASNYPRYDQVPVNQARPFTPMTTQSSGGQSEFYLALALGLVSPVLSFLLPIGGLLTAGYGIRSAIRAKEYGHPLGILVIVLNALAIGFWIFTRATHLGSGTFLR